MVSADGGASALSGAVTPKITPAGAGVTPSSASSYSGSGLYTYSNSDEACEFGTTVLATNNGQIAGSAASVVVRYFKMRAIDPDCVTPTFRTWIVTGSPDSTGAQYIGARCGVSSLTNITVAESWSITF